MIDSRAGAVLCNQCPDGNKNGDGIASLMWLTGWEFPKAVNQLGEYLGCFRKPKPEKGTAKKATKGTTRSNGTPGAAHALQQRALQQQGQPTSPPKEHVDPAKDLVFDPWNEAMVRMWCVSKKGVTSESVRAYGGQLAVYRGKYTVIAIPVYGPKLLAADPVGWVLFNQSGGMLPIFHGKGKPITQEKMKLTLGSQSGVIGKITAERLMSARNNPSVKE